MFLPGRKRTRRWMPSVRFVEEIKTQRSDYFYMWQQTRTCVPSEGSLWCNCQIGRSSGKQPVAFHPSYSSNSLHRFMGGGVAKAWWGCSQTAQQAELAHRELPRVLHLFRSYGSFWSSIMMSLARLRFVYTQQGLRENEQKPFKAHTKDL